MFTNCPSCERLYLIRAAQLKAADGWVRCGYCAETYYALERLYDVPVKHPAAQHQPEKDTTKPPVVNINAEQAAAAIERFHLTDADAVDQEKTTDTATAAPARVQSRRQDLDLEQEAVPAPRVRAADKARAAASQEEPVTVTTAGAEDREFLSDFPPLIDYESEKTGILSSRFIWTGLIFILLIITLTQLAWFNRDWLLREYPALTPLAQKVCEGFQCDLIRFRDLSAIKLLNKEVRQHPRYRNALLVSATIVNQAEFIQHYPDIELVIYATGGQVISHGLFPPSEYLGPDRKHSSGLSPGAPIHFTLGFAGSVQDAASFKFSFH